MKGQNTCGGNALWEQIQQKKTLPLSPRENVLVSMGRLKNNKIFSLNKMLS